MDRVLRLLLTCLLRITGICLLACKPYLLLHSNRFINKFTIASVQARARLDVKSLTSFVVYAALSAESCCGLWLARFIS